MFKKILLATLVVAGVSLFVLGPAAWSHARHGFKSLQSSVENSFPIEYDLDRAEQLVRDIGPEIDKARHAVAEEQVAIAELERDVLDIEKRLAAGEQKVKVRNAALKTGEQSFTYAGRVYSRKQMENDLRLAFDDYRNTEMVLDGKRKLLEARTLSLSAAIQKLDGVRSQEATLVANIGHLRARLHQAQALEAASSQVILDDGALARAKEILNRCRRRIEVAAKVVENETGASLASIPVEARDERDISAEVDRHFSGAPTALARDSGGHVE